jgi:hypothetical protein
VDEPFLVGDLIWRRNGIYTQPARVISLTPSGFRSAALHGCGEVKNHRCNRRGAARGVTRFNDDEIRRACALEKWQAFRHVGVNFDPHTLVVRSCTVRYSSCDVDRDTIGALIAELETAQSMLDDAAAGGSDV